MLKAFQNTLSSSLQDLFTLASSQCCKTRGFVSKICFNLKKQFCISYSGVKLWNSFKMFLKEIPKLSKFKRSIKNIVSLCVGN